MQSDDDVSQFGADIGLNSFGGRDAIIFLVDVSEQMLRNGHVEVALECVVNTMKNKAISSIADLVGLFLLGTSRTLNVLNLPNIYCFEELGQVDAEKIRRVQGLRDLDQFMGGGRAGTMADALWLCLESFHSFSVKIDSKRIFIFTDEDRPDEEGRERLVARVGDVYGAEAGITLIPFGDDFDAGAVYKDLIPNLDVSTLREDTECYLEQLRNRVFWRDRRRSLVSRTTLCFGRLRVDVAIHKLVQRSGRPPMRVEGSTGGRARQPTGDSGEDKSTLTVVGFVGRSFLQPFHHVGPGYLVRGEGELFSLLVWRCSERERLMLCRGRGRYVAMEPYCPQGLPCGFYMIPLPFGDDMREVEPPHRHCPSELVGQAKAIIGQLTFTYRPDQFENPTVRRFYSTLEAMALNLDNVEEFDDLTMPNLEEIQLRAGPLIDEFAGSVAGGSLQGSLEDAWDC